jgi:hypothetical protein
MLGAKRVTRRLSNLRTRRDMVADVLRDCVLPGAWRTTG